VYAVDNLAWAGFLAAPLQQRTWGSLGSAGGEAAGGGIDHDIAD
jgi:hypothetical protein